jgi:hypothetical protein
MVWLDRKPVSLEKMVYVVPSADLEPAKRITEYVAVMQRPPTREEEVGRQELNADVWLAPVKRDELRSVADILLRTAGKAPPVVKPSPLGALSPIIREAARQAARPKESKESGLPTP